ncbi:hypothetical protein BDV98DRAFT_574581 [Pterulicium gracile]|uniref:Uncharacterized protein n=1 Tax=Pterulicium gracile TaxID=1884261 RepID=A0A5C3QGT4_9AGAR|nr:hypothetical protein BDV98DRAFT_574581 [Pterula gracilis]
MSMKGAGDGSLPMSNSNLDNLHPDRRARPALLFVLICPRCWDVLTYLFILIRLRMRHLSIYVYLSRATISRFPSK